MNDSQAVNTSFVKLTAGFDEAVVNQKKVFVCQ